MTRYSPSPNNKNRDIDQTSLDFTFEGQREYNESPTTAGKKSKSKKLRASPLKSNSPKNIPVVKTKSQLLKDYLTMPKKQFYRKKEKPQEVKPVYSPFTKHKLNQSLRRKANT